MYIKAFIHHVLAQNASPRIGSHQLSRPLSFPCIGCLRRSMLPAPFPLWSTGTALALASGQEPEGGARKGAGHGQAECGSVADLGNRIADHTGPGGNRSGGQRRGGNRPSQLRGVQTNVTDHPDGPGESREEAKRPPAIPRDRTCRSQGIDPRRERGRSYAGLP